MRSVFLPRSTPTAEGVSASGIEAFLDRLVAMDLRLHSLMVIRHGAVVAEGWWRPYGPDVAQAMYSLSKSFTATAVGLAVAEGRLAITDPVVSFFPQELPPDAGPNLLAMRVRDLLTMTSGHDRDTTSRMREAGMRWVRGFLAIPVEHTPGTRFVYNSGASYMLSSIIQRLTGQTLLDYLTPRLLTPLGIVGARWETSPEGISAGGWGLSLRTEDIARFGLLYLGRGRWGDRQLLPEAWVEEATSKQVINGDEGASDWAQGYGYQFWRCRHGAYRGDGAHGQFCIVLPAEDAVVAITAGTTAMQKVLDQVWAHLLPALHEGPSGDDAALRARLDTLSLAPLVHSLEAGRTYRLAPNTAGLDAITLQWTPETCALALLERGEWRHIVAGFGQWVENGPQRCAACARWTPVGALRFDWAFLDRPIGATMEVRPSSDGVEVAYRSNLADPPGAIVVLGR